MTHDVYYEHALTYMIMEERVFLRFLMTIRDLGLSLGSIFTDAPLLL